MLFYVVIVLGIVVPTLAFYKKALTIPASILAMFMILVALVAGENYALFLILAFMLITVVDKVCKNRLKNAEEDINLKTGARDIVQVFANGGISLLCALLWYYSQNEVFLLAYASALIESFADSAASDIGIAVGQQAYDICHLRKVKNGLSGGVTLAGTFGSLLACCLMSVAAFGFGIASSMQEIILLSCVPFFGCIMDSILGSLVQRKNKCVVCGKITEKTVHCKAKTEYYSGLKVFNNDLVNLTCNAIAAIAIFILVK